MYMRFLEKAKLRDREQISGGLGLEWTQIDHRWPWGNFLEWWKCFKTGLWRWLHNYADFTKAYQCAHLKWVDFLICQLYIINIEVFHFCQVHPGAPLYARLGVETFHLLLTGEKTWAVYSGSQRLPSETPEQQPLGAC